jgi:ribonuclease HI
MSDGPFTQADVDFLLKHFKIKSWDVLLIGDGSGSTWNRGAGWASVSIEHENMEVRTWAGGVNYGTVNFAEIMAYLQPLTYFQGRNKTLQGRNKTLQEALAYTLRPYTIHIVTDSEYVQKMGDSKRRGAIKNGTLWSCFDIMARQGFLLRWHWMRRDTSAFNTYCDTLSRFYRKLVENGAFDGNQRSDDVPV